MPSCRNYIHWKDVQWDDQKRFWMKELYPLKGYPAGGSRKILDTSHSPVRCSVRRSGTIFYESTTFPTGIIHNGMIEKRL